MQVIPKIPKSHLKYKYRDDFYSSPKPSAFDNAITNFSLNIFFDLYFGKTSFNQISHGEK